MMKTLIELYDERPIENLLATDVFRPERTVFLCPPEAYENKALQENIRRFFDHRGIKAEAVFLETSLYKTEKVVRQLEKTTEEYPDCAAEIAGGTDASLFACGMASERINLPVFTYSRKKNSFFNICGAEFAEDVKPGISYTAEDFFLMAGGSVKEGRVEDDSLRMHAGSIDAFFNLFLRYRKKWGSIVSWIQRSSQGNKDGAVRLHVSAPYEAKGDRGSRIQCPEDALEDFQKIGFIKNLRINGRQSVSFDFKDSQIRYWLRDMGSVLEIYTWKACLDSGKFSDVRCSTIVGWDNGPASTAVTNEIDVMAVSGIVPLFISCKTCPVDTDAINELAILKDRFGGQMAKAALVSTENCRAVTRRRAASLGIDIIDINDIKGKKTLSELIAETYA